MPQDRCDIPGTKGFRIYRLSHHQQPHHGLEFDPPSGSDELFDVLRAAFPNGKSHRARMLEALIGFLQNELDSERQTVLQCSPVLDNSATAVSSKAPAEVVPFSVAPESDSPIGRTEADWRSMITIWDSKNSLHGQRKFRRKMDKGELHDYRKRRTLGACAACKIRKRKCTHDHKADKGGYETDSEDNVHSFERSRTNLLCEKTPNSMNDRSHSCVGFGGPSYPGFGLDDIAEHLSSPQATSPELDHGARVSNSPNLSLASIDPVRSDTTYTPGNVHIPLNFTVDNEMLCWRTDFEVSDAQIELSHELQLPNAGGCHPMIITPEGCCDHEDETYHSSDEIETREKQQDVGQWMTRGFADWY